MGQDRQKSRHKHNIHTWELRGHNFIIQGEPLSPAQPCSEVKAKCLSVSVTSVSTGISHVDVCSRSALILITGVNLQC